MKPFSFINTVFLIKPSLSRTSLITKQYFYPRLSQDAVQTILQDLLQFIITTNKYCTRAAKLYVSLTINILVVQEPVTRATAKNYICFYSNPVSFC